MCTHIKPNNKYTTFGQCVHANFRARNYKIGAYISKIQLQDLCKKLKSTVVVDIFS
jgi:uncharacterized protein YlbG (UPF0298 family)